MSKVYIVTDGEYSDFHIVAGFSEDNEKDAIELSDRLGSGPPMEMELNPSLSEFEFIDLRMRRDGSIESLVHLTSDGQLTGMRRFIEDVNSVTPMMNYVTEGADEQRAIKAANDARTRLIANNLWPMEARENKFAHTYALEDSISALQFLAREV